MTSLASNRLHVLVVEIPGSFVLRATVERAVLRRGWRLSQAPADADAVVVCGSPATPTLEAAIQGVWEQLPGPRSMTSVESVDVVDAALDGVAAHYRDLEGQRRDAHGRGGFGVDVEHAQMDHGQMDHGQRDHGQMEPAQMDHAQMDHAQMEPAQMEPAPMDHGHGGMEPAPMDHGRGGMGSSGPGGIALAAGGADRDGLQMDVLHLRLGPILADWPAGLVIWCGLQGDVITRVDIEIADAPVVSGLATARVAYRIDAAARVLSLAGALRASARLRGLRDGLLEGLQLDAVSTRVEQVRRAVAGSRSLRWSLADVGRIDNGLLGQHRWPVSWIGDVRDRLLFLLDVDSVAAIAASEEVAAGGPAEMSAIATVAPLVLSGMELGGARLAVASLVGHPTGTSPAFQGRHQGGGVTC